MFTDQSVILLVNTLPNGGVFKQPISKDARALLTVMINQSRLWPGILPKFAAQFDPINYEEICQKYNTYKFKDLLKGCKPKTDEEKLDILTLRIMKSYEWSSRLDNNTHKVGTISNPRSAEVYRWLTSHFLLTDFNNGDLNKISYLGDDRFSLDIIKAEASKILDSDKHSIPYLYAIILDVTERNRIVVSKENKIEKKYSDKLARLMQDAAEPKQAYSFDGDESSRWERERAYLDLLKQKDE